MNKKLVKLSTAAAIGSLLAACGSAASSERTAGEGADETIKIALIPAKSGAMAQMGSAAVQGWQLAVDQANDAGGVAGRKVELVIKETDSDPAATVRMAREAVTKDGAQFISGVITSPENAALNVQLEGLGALSINPLGKDDALIGENCSPNAFHISHTPTMDINTIAQVLDDIPGDRWAIQAMDYGTGHNAAATFKEAAKAAGKEVVLTQFAPLATADFGSYITKILGSGADAVFVAEFGADGVNFVKQSAQFELDEQVSTVLGLSMIDESSFSALGDSIVGYYNNVAYQTELDNELNRAFVAAYIETFDEAPFWVPADSYLGAQLLFAAIEEADSIEPADVREALSGLTIDSIVGEVSVRPEDHQLMRPGFVGKVVEAGNDKQFEVIASTTAEENIPAPSADCTF